jgi:hypothetical protein
MTSDSKAPRPGLAGEEPDQRGLSWHRYEPQRRTNEPHGPCPRCGGLGDAHYLTCPLLRLTYPVSQLPDEDEPPL